MELFKKRYNYEIPQILKMFGVTRICDNSIEFKYGYISFFSHFELLLDHSYKEGVPRWCIGLYFVAFHIEMPFLKQRYDDVNNSPEYGMKYHSKTVWWHWGLENYTLRMPWDWEHTTYEVMTADGWRVSSYEYLDFNDTKYLDGRLSEIYDYKYKLKSGEIQERKARVYLKRRTWKWHWFKWLPYPKLTNAALNIDFDQEVGEKTGSWKGGVMGCSYEWENGESMQECLRRMENERKL